MQNKTYFFYLFLFLNFPSVAFTQISQQQGNIFSEISSKITNMPSVNGNEYTEPDSTQLKTWEETLNEMLLGNYSIAADSANVIGYQLVEFKDTFNTPFTIYYILETIDSNYWGTYVYNPNYCRPLVIQSPHSIRDVNTGLQGAHVFLETQALFFQVNGTNRCNSSTFSSCSGTSSNCTGSSEPYRISDLAHTTQSLFQKTTEVLLNAFSDTYFFQFHGFNKQSTDPYVILSNGTQQTPSPDFFPSFANNLYNEDTVLTFRIAHIDTNWTRLRGFFNTQSRLVNGSSNHCTTNATSTNGRFFHIEQERTRLRSNANGWNKVAKALANTFSCISVSIFENKNEESIKVYPNPAKSFVNIEWNTTEVLEREIYLYNLLGQNINELIHIDYINNNKSTIFLDKLPKGFYFLRVGSTSTKLYKN